jgi:purine-binding chemotaxis protein CheW
MIMDMMLYEKKLPAQAHDLQSFVTMRVHNQLFGASVKLVQDVVRAQKIAPIPLAPPVIQGAINLRGRIVTVFNMYRRLGLPVEQQPEKHMNVVIEYRDELFSLMVDSVGDVLNIPLSKIDKPPVNMQANWQEIAAGVYRLDNEILLLLDVERLLAMNCEK